MAKELASFKQTHPQQAHPINTPIKDWPEAWLVFETAAQLDVPGYIWMYEHERAGHKWPSSREERIAFVEEKWRPENDVPAQGR